MKFGGMQDDPVALLLSRLPPKLRPVPVIFGAVLIHLSLGTYHTFGNMLPYIASYMRLRNKDMTYEQLMWIPTFQGCFPFAMIVGGFLALRLTPRVAAFIGCAFMSGGVFLSYLTVQSSIGLFMLTYGVMFGFGQGVAYVIAVSCVINWTPRNVGVSSGLVAGAFGVSAAIFTPIQTSIVNPENFVVDSQGYFTESVLLDRVPPLFRTLSFIYAAMQTIGLIFICDPPDGLIDPRRRGVRRCISDSIGVDVSWRWLGTTTSGMRNRRRTKNPRATAVATTTVATVGLTEEEKAKLVETDIEYSEDHLADLSADGIDVIPTDVLRSGAFYALFVTLFCCSFYGNLYYNLYKTFATQFILDDMFMAVAFSVGTVANACARIFWGFIADKFSFQLALVSATSFAAFLLFTMPLTAYGGKPMYMVWLILMFVCIAANQTLFITAAVKCFGSKHKAINYGMLIFSTTISGIILSAICQTLLSKVGYTVMFTAAGIAALVGFGAAVVTRFTERGRNVRIKKRAALNFFRIITLRPPIVGAPEYKQFDTPTHSEKDIDVEAEKS